MTEVEIDGHTYIGYLSIPKLELELPIMADWSYPKLQISPCRYTGSVRGEDLVLMAHNYASHFGGLSKLSEGDSVIFTDMDGIITAYEVVAQDVLDPYAVEEMTSGDFDLTLFTCTYGGKSRVTVYCDRVS
jgi:sortase A